MFSKIQLAVLIGALASVSSAAPYAVARKPTTTLKTLQHVKRQDGPQPIHTGDATFAAKKANLVKLGCDGECLSVTYLEHSDLLDSDDSQNGANDQNIGLLYAKHDQSYGDSANFGLFNLNWYMIRTAGCAGFENAGVGQWQEGAQLNHDTPRALACYSLTRQKFTGRDWYGVQRSGQSECNSESITQYQNAIASIRDYNQQHLNDSTWASYTVHYQGSC